MSKIIGIDLGTTNSVVAAIQDGRPRVLVSKDGARLLPSVVGLSPADELLVGDAAKNQYLLYPERTIKSVKRMMGQDVALPLGEKTFSPPQISAFILERLRETAAATLGEEVRQAVITVPAYFTDAQRQATRQAGELAGLEVVRIINEPTAAALAYGLESRDSRRALVYDLGGGTFDVSVVEINEGVVEVIATAGNNHLGGDDFDARLVDFLIRHLQEESGVDLSDNRRAMARLTRAAEEAKIKLSTQPFVQINEPFIAERGGQAINLEVELSRNQFEAMIADLLQETVSLIQRVLQDAQLKPADLDIVLLVGGSTRIPAVFELVKNHLGQVPRGEINPDECVALGAAVQAGIIAGEPLDMVFVDVAPYSLGIQILGEQFGIVHPDVMRVLIPRNTAIPTSRAEVFSTVHDNQSAVKISVYQGESLMASKNTLLGEFTLSGIPPMPAGQPQIVVQFDYDVDGIVHVSATERSTGKNEHITITRASEEMAAATETAGAQPEAPDRRAARRRRAVLRQAKKLAQELEGEDKAALLGLVTAIERAEKQGDTAQAAALVEDLWDLLYEKM
ncbi:Heat shock protein 70 family [Moorella glycerini]|uniref:Chaperone protein DnaK n=1 Tax=Neomoorella stamsii TaxID=1266720 RepID=A0A9X7J2A5_9FIRM|nr:MULTISPECIES: Hsp70 family protein [Moorella]PRR72319.1 Chaperone protein DnaK [Moorella stamsii]CEP68870.1 Heat shock protein 70 family [Moorella glycerini]